MALTFRPGTLNDSLAVFEVFQEAILDLSRRTGVMVVSGGHDPTRIPSVHCTLC